MDQRRRKTARRRRRRRTKKRVCFWLDLFFFIGNVVEISEGKGQSKMDYGGNQGLVLLHVGTGSKNVHTRKKVNEYKGRGGGGRGGGEKKANEKEKE